MLGTNEFDFNAETFDSRDVIDRIEYLESDESELTEDEAEELAKLRTIAEDGKDSAEDWEYGATFIAEWYFEDYARELAEDIGAIDPDVGWPNSYIDWERAARDLQMDYTSIEVDGTTYYVR